MVSDSGCGISEVEQVIFFYCYVQVCQGCQQIGFGLGLVICKELVVLMQGCLEMVSCLGVGIIFIIMLLVKVSCCVIYVLQVLFVRLQVLFGLVILIVDDYFINWLLFKCQFSIIGYSVDEVCDGEEVENKFVSKYYDLLIIDFNMLKKDGLVLVVLLCCCYLGLVIWGVIVSVLLQLWEVCLVSGMNMCLFKLVLVQMLSYEFSCLVVGCVLFYVIWYLKFSVLSENMGGDQVLMNEMLEMFCDVLVVDLQVVGQVIVWYELQIFLWVLYCLYGLV